MKSIVLIISLLLFPPLAIADVPFPWQNTYNGVAGGLTSDLATIKNTAMSRAHDAAINGCDHNPYYGNTSGVQIGQMEPPPDCQCVDAVCICTDKLTLFCQAK